MADKRRAAGRKVEATAGAAGGGGGSGGPPVPTSTARPEPGLAARVVAQQFSTVMLITSVIVIGVGWAMYGKVQMGLSVPAPLWAYLAVSLAIMVMTLGLRFALGAQVAEVLRREGTEKDARHLLKEARKGVRGRGPRLSPVQAEEIGRAADSLDEALAGDDWDRTGAAVAALDQKLDDFLGTQRKSTTREYAESILIAIGIALFLRAFVVEAFKIPSGSMIPTLLVGDHIFVNKFIYGVRIPWTDIKLGMSIRKPERGEVVVFKYPKDPEKDFIKRIVAVEGDTVEIKENVLYVNGRPTPREHVQTGPCEYEDFDELTNRWEHRRCDAWRETLNGHTYTTYYDRVRGPTSWPQAGSPPMRVPAGAVFVMGDNRDNSHDSRYWGSVPFELLRGKAMIIWLSVGEPEAIRVNRIGQVIH